MGKSGGGRNQNHLDEERDFHLEGERAREMGASKEEILFYAFLSINI